MTFLAMLALFFGIFLVSDGAFARGLLVKPIPEDAGAVPVVIIQFLEIVVGGLIFIALGFGWSRC